MDKYIWIDGESMAMAEAIEEFLIEALQQQEERVIGEIEKHLYTENGFFREDSGVAPDVQRKIQEIKLLNNKG